MNRYILPVAAAIFALSTPAAAFAAHHEGGHDGHKCEQTEEGKMKCCAKDKDGKMACRMKDHSKMDHSKMDHSKMDHSKMDHSKMDHSKMAQPEAPAAEPN